MKYFHYCCLNQSYFHKHFLKIPKFQDCLELWFLFIIIHKTNICNTIYPRIPLSSSLNAPAKYSKYTLSSSLNLLQHLILFSQLKYLYRIPNSGKLNSESFFDCRNESKYVFDIFLAFELFIWVISLYIPPS